MVAEEVVVTLSGGAPWGFRLQGGTEQKQPLQVSKVIDYNILLISFLFSTVKVFTVPLHVDLVSGG